MPTSDVTDAQRQAERAWRLLQSDVARAGRLLDKAIPAAEAAGDAHGLAWLQLVQAYMRLYAGALEPAEAELTRLAARFGQLEDRRGAVLAEVGLARSWWRQGQAERALQRLLPLRTEGLTLLRRDERSVLLNALGGCHSSLGSSEQALACMYQALRDVGPAGGTGFDITLRCNLSHELLELGDVEDALRQVETGLERIERLGNPRLETVLRVNQALCLSELRRNTEALHCVQRLSEATGNALDGGLAELLALPALRGGDRRLADALIEAASPQRPDDHVALHLACALRAQQDGRLQAARDQLDAAAPRLTGRGDARVSLLLRSVHALAQADLLEAMGQLPEALAAWRDWRQLQNQRAERAAAARQLGAILQTELLQLKYRLQENETRRRAAEQARAALAEANQQLKRKIAEVQVLQSQLQAQATQDALTGLANRRHLNDTLPTQLALAQREAAPLSAVLIDLDHFKRVNDSYGHPVGDQLLAAFGALLREHLRKSDQAFRYGGEEFCLLLPNTPAEDARTKVAALQKRWKATVFDLPDGSQLGGQSFSAGVTDSITTPDSGTALLRVADDRLLCAKRTQRGTVVSS